MPPPLASTLLVDALLLGLLAVVRGDVTLACAALALLGALRTVRVAKRTSTGARRAVALGVALSMAGEAGLAAWRVSTLRTAGAAAAVLVAAIYAWVTSPALRR